MYGLSNIELDPINITEIVSEDSTKSHISLVIKLDDLHINGTYSLNGSALWGMYLISASEENFSVKVSDAKLSYKMEISNDIEDIFENIDITLDYANSDIKFEKGPSWFIYWFGDLILHTLKEHELGKLHKSIQENIKSLVLRA